jgi:osmotically-inducible protein OsmY
MRILNHFVLCLLLALVLGVSVPATAHATDTAPAGNTDAILTQDLQKQLSEHLEFRNVTVQVDDRIATLQGSVENYREKQEAEKLARKHRKIEGIRDYITVVPLLTVKDQELRTTLEDRLRYDRIGYGIQFNNLQLAVKDGVVTVSGDVRTYPDKASALAIIEDTPGVRDVRDQINVLPLSSFDDDLRVRTAKAIYGDSVLHKYSLDPQAPIRIIVENGHVKLYGVVDSAMDKHIAELRAQEVSSVFSVENNLVVANEANRTVAENAKADSTPQPHHVEEK